MNLLTAALLLVLVMRRPQGYCLCQCRTKSLDQLGHISAADAMMYLRITRLSVQKNSWIFGYSNSFLKKSLTLAKVVAASNSNLGIVLCFRDVTCAFPTMEEQ